MSTPLETRESAYRDAIGVGRVKMLLILAACAAPVIASYVSFYFLKPEGRINHGTLIEPAKPLPDAALTHLDGRPFRFSEFRGKWLLLTLDGGACAGICPDKLLKMRQLRTMQGKDRDRIERAWLITDDVALETMLIREFDGTRMLRAKGAPLLAEFPAAGDRGEHIYLIDPLGNLVMRYPKDANPMKMNTDLKRLLKYSRIG